MNRHSKFLRFISVGVLNTIIGYSSFALFNYCFEGFRYGYLYASVICNITSITIAYINYKFLVFKTKGNYHREYLRFFLVYGVTFFLSLLLMPVLVEHFHINSYLAALLLLPLGTIISFIGHSKFSFHHKSVPPSGESL